MTQVAQSSNHRCYDESALKRDIDVHLKAIYPDDYQQLSDRLLQLISTQASQPQAATRGLWSQQDVLLISYGNSIYETDVHPLKSLHKFLRLYLSDCINSLHILPFFPFSSDDGFSVIDYYRVNPELGDWEDINALAKDFRLMFDLVINHVSRESLWFYDFVGNVKPACDYFIELDPDTDVSQVTRPRNTPLLVPVNTHRGTRYLWATFSEDQIDVNFSNPEVLLEYIRILLFYMNRGAKMIRLDAIAFLWKQLGTSCIHRSQTHEVVKLIRDIFNHLYRDCILLTETNVPHEENLSYFGDGDEAHMVYQFTLPPLVLHAMNRGNAAYLTRWASELPPLPKHCTYLNFTASHDGIGLRSLEGILSRREVDDLIDSMHRFGGFVSMKANPQGEDTPYEINISLFDAMQGTRRGQDQWQAQRFICSQAIMLSLQGIPAMYIHSLLATPNDLHGVELSGRTRSINRKSWPYEELIDSLESTNTLQHQVFESLRELLRTRRHEPCFHPDNPQQVIDISNGLFAVLRTDGDTGRKLLAIHNVTSSPQDLTLQDRPDLSDEARWHDLVSNKPVEDILPLVTLQPYQFMWLVEEYADQKIATESQRSQS